MNGNMSARIPTRQAPFSLATSELDATVQNPETENRPPNGLQPQQQKFEALLGSRISDSQVRTHTGPRTPLQSQIHQSTAHFGFTPQWSSSSFFSKFLASVEKNIRTHREFKKTSWLRLRETATRHSVYVREEVAPVAEDILSGLREMEIIEEDMILAENQGREQLEAHSQ